MNAQQMLIDYAEANNTNENLTAQQFIGQAITEGIVVGWTPNSKTIANVRREGKTIILTETLKEETNEIVDGKMVFGKKETTTEIFRVNV